MIPIKTSEEIAQMKKSGQILSEIMDVLERMVVPGICTQDLDDRAVQEMKQRGVRSAFKGYQGYPANICVSVNEEVVHGIPGKKKIIAGDIVSVDIGIERDGHFVDMAKTFAAGAVDPVKQRLMVATKESLDEAIKVVRAGENLACIARAIQPYVESRGFSVVRDFVGHGIGKSLHEEPQIPNFVSRDDGPRLFDGMVLAIEPMINVGVYEVVLCDDGWTAVTKDRMPSAHFEHTVALVDGSAVVITR
jgi:methionyl aminopeptidase